MKNNKVTTVELRKLIRESVQEVMAASDLGGYEDDVGVDPIEAIQRAVTLLNAATMEAVNLLNRAMAELEHPQGPMGE
jgi:hypothetical protein